MLLDVPSLRRSTISFSIAALSVLDHAGARSAQAAQSLSCLFSGVHSCHSYTSSYGYVSPEKCSMLADSL